MLGDDVASRKTYRYLRIGILGAVVLLAASVLVERNAVLDLAKDCWQTSISAYYYTPARAVFVGALMAIGLCLIVIKGNTSPEDICLNVGGMLAPVVALVPIGNPGTCWSLEPEPPPTVPIAGTDKTELAPWVEAIIKNNIEALLWAGLAGLATAVIIALIAFAVGAQRGGPERRSLSDLWNAKNRGTFFSLLLMFGLLVGTWQAFRHWGAFNENAHGLAANTMFGLLALAALVNFWDCRRYNRHWYSRLYLLIAVLMAGAALLLFIDDDDWNHKTLVVEFLEIGLFAGFWIVQTRELWHTTVRSSAANLGTGAYGSPGAG